MKHLLEEFNITKQRLKQLLLRNKLVASTITLLTLLLVALYWSGVFDAPDPQGQVGAGWIKPVGSEVAYVGNATCQPCHPHEFQLYNASPHSRTVQMIPVGQERPEFVAAQTVRDDRNGILYSVRKGAGQNQIVATTGATSETDTARWIFGSGNHAWTYLSQHGPQFRQLKITYYPPSRTWNFTPGSGPGEGTAEALGDAYTPVQAAACFGCHSTVLTGTRKSLDLEHSRLNVGCESCHGPGRSHVESVQGGATANGTTANGSQAAEAALVTPPLHNGPQIMQLCGLCHRMPVASGHENALGETLLARFPGVALVRSRCFTASAGKLSCITCHNPHESTKEQQLSSFEAKCLSCHTAPHGKPCARGETTNCITCHMPEEAIARKIPLRFHNHWIRKNPFGMSQNPADIPHNS
ncbi:MAG: hypothetical protein JO316_09180 [Abitibacteriaceae bacterium]|nr:hypothetical protein [Abditibacteriaceae bacterium]MBV9865509.1 hypothetical protein [Abditibacteriaceae bacterium]